MKIKLVTTALSIACIFINTVRAQTILNPSFENVSAPGCSYNLTNSAFNSYMSNVYAFGTYENCDIINSSCGYGIAQDGNWFIALSVPPTGGVFDAIAVELSSPMQAGQTYELSFYQKKDLGYNSNPLDIGYSDTDSTMGMPVAALPAVTSTTWILTSVVFTPSFNAQYITFRAVPSVYGWNQIDNMQLTNVTSVIENNHVFQGVTVFPNPANKSVFIIADFKEGNEIQVNNALGKVLFRKKISTQTSDFPLPTSDFSNGIYFLSVQTDEKIITKKIIVQH